MGKIFRVLSAAVLGALLFSGCTGSSPAPTESAQSSVSPPSAGPSTSARGESTSKPSPVSTATSKSQPVPKVQRTGAPAPSVSAKPASTDGKVTYADGVQLRIVNVKFGKEKKEGPGRFVGRAYAILDLQIKNGSTKALSLDTVVVTVLNKSGNPVNPVYVEEAKVSDFAGDLKPGSTVKARYAFAVPASSRSKVTVVVDFDGVHTSAVFRGGLS